MESAIAPAPKVLESALRPTDLHSQVQLIQQVMHSVMKKDEHYGVVPGTDKPTLLKPGAEKLCLTFRLDPQFHSVEAFDGPHVTIKSTCTIFHINSGLRLGSGEGSCSSKETKYAFRNAARTCPKCGKESIIKGKKEYGGGWLCFKKKDGCGLKFADGDSAIEGQVVGLVPTENLADQYNTILKMANKRALVAAVLVVTAASDIFTQDLEEKMPPRDEEQEEQRQSPETNKQTARTKMAELSVEDKQFLEAIKDKGAAPVPVTSGASVAEAIRPPLPSSPASAAPSDYILKVGRQKGQAITDQADDNLGWAYSYYSSKLKDQPESKYRDEWELALAEIEQEQKRRG